jgi:[ribosomal protein S5]-alanine N-acetyltransferase
MIVVETERLILRHFHIFDLEAMLNVFGDAEVMRFGSGVQTRQWIQDWLHDCLERYYAKWGFGPWAIVEKLRTETIGYCGLFYFPDIDGTPEVEIGYRLAHAFWGSGYATEAALAVRNYGFEILGLSRLIAIIDPQNTASIHVAQKLGMRREKEIMLEGYTHPDHVYSVANPKRG